MSGTTDAGVVFPIAERDRIQPVADVPGWSENLLAFVHDPAAGIAVWAHWGRAAGAPHVWEAVLSVHLPGGTLLVDRAFAPASHAATAGGGALTLAGPDADGGWRLGFDGTVRATAERALRDAPLADGPREPLRIDLTFTPIMPTWDAHAGMEEQAWATAHLQQAGRVTGVVRSARGDVGINAVGFRDHSHGPRDHAALLGDSVCWAAFPDGRALMALELWQRGDRPSVGFGYLWDGEELHAVRSVRSPRLAALDGGAGAAVVTFDTDAGAGALEVTADPGMWWTFDEPTGITAGVRLGDDEMVGLERPVGIVWNGAVGTGWLEQILRPSSLET